MPERLNLVHGVGKAAIFAPRTSTMHGQVPTHASLEPSTEAAIGGRR
jgi:hypothetical protein